MGYKLCINMEKFVKCGYDRVTRIQSTQLIIYVF